MNNLRKLKLIRKHYIDCHDSPYKRIELVKKELAELGFMLELSYGSLYSFDKVYKFLHTNFTSKQRRSIFRVARAIKKKGDLFDLLDLYKCHTNISCVVNKKQYEYISTLKRNNCHIIEKNQLGDLRKFLSFKQTETLGILKNLTYWENDDNQDYRLYLETDKGKVLLKMFSKEYIESLML